MANVKLHRSWRTAEGIFGGYVVARALQAAVVDGFEPLSISVQFLGGVQPGECDLRVDTVHQGATTAVLNVDVVQEHRRAAGVVKLGRGAGDRIVDELKAMADLPRPEELPRGTLPYGPFPYEQHLETRLLPDPPQTRCVRTRGWVRIRAATASKLPAPAAACVILDTLPPGLFFEIPAPAFVPTIDFTAHFAPHIEWGAGDWAFVVQNTRWATRDFCVEDASLYRRDGRLLAEARQARRVRWPRV